MSERKDEPRRDTPTPPEGASREPASPDATASWGSSGALSGAPSTGTPTPPSPETIGTNRPRWDIEDTHPELVEEIKKALRTVVDPELGVDIIALGLVRNVQITDDEAKITMILTTPFCPYGPALLEMARQKVEMVVKKPTTLEIGNEVWDMSMLEDGDILKQWGLWW